MAQNIGQLEHINLTVSDPENTANWLCDIFGWHIRWQGDSIHGGHTIHVGTDTDYLALYNPGKESDAPGNTYTRVAGLNHVGILVDDLDPIEEKVRAHGFKMGDHHDYEPGRRFYFHDPDGIEFEVITYT